MKKSKNISSTSAMVLVWLGKKFYTHANTLKYFNHLDLTEGELLAKELTSIWDSYDEVIKNRKFAIKHFAFDFLSKNTKAQVVILAAGLDPLSVEIASYFPEAKIFDTDMDNMQIKKDLVNQTTDVDNVQFVTADITKSENFKNSLIQSGWEKNKNTLLIAEGITYYLNEEDLWEMPKCFSSSDNSNAFIMEYMLPLSLVDEKFCHIPMAVFEKLSKIFNLNEITEYTEDIIEKRLLEINGKLQTTWSFLDMEKNRTNKQKLFHKKEEGWVQVSYSLI